MCTHTEVTKRSLKDCSKMLRSSTLHSSYIHVHVLSSCRCLGILGRCFATNASHPLFYLDTATWGGTCELLRFLTSAQTSVTQQTAPAVELGSKIRVTPKRKISVLGMMRPIAFHCMVTVSRTSWWAEILSELAKEWNGLQLLIKDYMWLPLIHQILSA